MNQQGSVQYLPVSKEQQEAEIISNLIINGDLSRLHPLQKIEYYKSICERIGLDPMTQPFKLIFFKKSKKEILYCSRSGAQQLNKLHRVSHRITSREIVFDCYTVVARASLPNGRKTESLGAVSVTGLESDNFANALMKAETKAKRRATLDLLGLGVLDESELETIPDAQTAPVDVTPAPEAPEAIEDRTPKIHPDDLMTEKQKDLISKLVKSSLFSEDEKQKAAEFLSRPKKKKSASKFIDRLLALKKEREAENPVILKCDKCSNTVKIKKNEAKSKGWDCCYYDSSCTDIYWLCPDCQPEPYSRPEPEGTPDELRAKARAVKARAAYADDPSAYSREMSEAGYLLRIADKREKELTESEPMSEADAEELRRNCLRHGIAGNDRKVLYDFVVQTTGFKEDSFSFFNELNNGFQKYAKEAGLLP